MKPSIHKVPGIDFQKVYANLKKLKEQKEQKEIAKKTKHSSTKQASKMFV